MSILAWILHSVLLLTNSLLFIVAVLIVIGANLSFINRKRKGNNVRLRIESMVNVVTEVKLDDPAILLIIPCSTKIEENISTSVDENILCQSSKKISCFCDGSFSSKTKIGFSGVRTSNGYSNYQHCRLRYYPRGSTESEVFAACLALEYTAQDQYDQIVIYTDNSKVEQLLKRPTTKDERDYPRFFTALKENQLKNNSSNISVERVRGHPTRREQKQSTPKREFAQVDYEVREKRRQFEQEESQLNYNIRIPFLKEDFNRFGPTRMKTKLYRSKSFPLLKNDSQYHYSNKYFRLRR